MVAEKEQLTKSLRLGAECRVLEVMSDESGFSSELAKMVREIETIEEDSEQAKIDMIIVNADRLEQNEEIWSQIEQLAPRLVLLTYREIRIGEYNKRLMKAGGFRVVKQDSELSNAIAKRYCVGYRNR